MLNIFSCAYCQRVIFSKLKPNLVNPLLRTQWFPNQNKTITLTYQAGADLVNCILCLSSFCFLSCHTGLLSHLRRTCFLCLKCCWLWFSPDGDVGASSHSSGVAQSHHFREGLPWLPWQYRQTIVTSSIVLLCLFSSQKVQLLFGIFFSFGCAWSLLLHAGFL